MVGIPLYAPEPGLHGFIVQAAGASDETVRGILNLASLGQAAEIRMVIQRHTVPALASLAAFIARNLPFVAQVALMGLEMTGLARPNSPLVWVDPADYQRELAEAAGILVTAAIATRIYNHQLCVLGRRLWPYAVRSISDWKRSATGRTATPASAAPARSAMHAASSPQAATAPASTCARCLDQPAAARRSP